MIGLFISAMCLVAAASIIAHEIGYYRAEARACERLRALREEFERR